MTKSYLVVKKVSTAPTVGEPDTLYLLQDGVKLRIYCSDAAGTSVLRIMDETDTNSLINTILLLLSGQPDGLATLDEDSKVEQTAIASDKWASAITLLLKGDVGGSVTFDGSGSVEMFVSKPHSPVMTYLDGRLDRVDYYDSSFKTLGYVGEDLTTMVKVQGERVFVTTMNYDNEGNVISAPQTEITPQNVLSILNTQLNFVSEFPSGVSFSRPSVQERTSPIGLKEIMPPNVPCIDHSLAGVPLGLLIEPAETNLISNSNQFSNWLRLRSESSDLTVIGPDGQTSASKLTETVYNDAHNFASSPFTIKQNTPYTFVIRLKADQRFLFKIELVPTFTEFPDAFMIANLLVGQPTSVMRVDGHGIEIGSNGYYTVHVTVTALINSSNAKAMLSIRDNDNRLSYLGETGKGFFAADAMVLENAVTVTGHIPTTTTSASRAAQNVFIDGNNFASMVGSKGTILLECVSKLIPSGSNQVVLSVDDGTLSNVVQLSRTSMTSASLRITTPTTTVDVATPITSSLTSKMVLVWSSFYFQLWCNGQLIHTESGLTLSLSRLRIAGGGIDGIPFIGHVKQMRVWKDIMLTPAIAQFVST